MDQSQQDIQPVWQQQQQPHHQYQNYPDQNYPHQSYPEQNYPEQNYPDQNYHGQAYFDQATKKPLAQSEIVEDARRASILNAKGRPKPDYRPMALRWWYI